jgi:hypothetical protein
MLRRFVKLFLALYRGNTYNFLQILVYLFYFNLKIVIPLLEFFHYNIFLP